MSTVVGVISDTHGVLRSEVFDHFSDVSLIIHAGDIGSEFILPELETIAPVEAVYGNIDGFPLIEELPERKSIQIEKVRVFVTHTGGTPEEMRARCPEVLHSQLVIFGHTHRPLHFRDGETVFFNPGSAGPRRFSLPVTVGKIRIDASRILAQIIEIQV